MSTSLKKSIGFVLSKKKKFNIYDDICAFCYQKKIDYMPDYDCYNEVFGMYLFSFEEALKVNAFITQQNLKALYVNIIDS